MELWYNLFYIVLMERGQFMALRNTLLLVGDAGSRTMMRRLFEEQFCLLETEGGEQAVLLLEQNMERIAAVLLQGCCMLSGEPLLQYLNRTGVTGRVPVVAIADDHCGASDEWAIEHGAADLISDAVSRSVSRKRMENLIRLFHGNSPEEKTGSLDKKAVLTPALKSRLEHALEKAETELPDPEIYRVIMECTGDVAFQWDMRTDVLRCSPKWEERFGYSPICREASANLFVISHFHPDDLTHLQEKIESLRRGTEQGEATVRIVDAEGKYSWNRIRAVGLRDHAGELTKVIGVIADVDSDQRASHALIKRAERDSLTGMLNKAAARRQVEQFLEKANGEQRAALLIVDLDDFKEINDRYGHMFGDAVLTRAAAAIRGLFREKDILARIGGDEFMVFMQDIPDGELVQRRCDMLLETLKSLLDSRIAGQVCSCSVGFALMPDHGVSYQTLFQRADRALYQAKACGKNTSRCYEAADSAVDYRSKVSQRIDSDVQGRINIGTYANFALETLRETDDEGGTIRLLMELIGTQIQASRIYLYANDPENRTCTNRFEWCAKGVEPMGSLYPVLSYDKELQGFAEAFNEQGVIYASEIETLPESIADISERDGSKAVLLRALIEKGVFRGFVGVDVCDEKRLWTQDEIEVLTLLSHLASLWLPRIKT